MSPPARARRASATGAALGLAALLWLHAVVGGAGPSQPFPCPDPRGAASAGAGPARVACGPGAPGEPLAGAPALLFGRRLDLNAAPIRAFEALPGVGPVRAAAIGRERCRRPFAGPADLERVHGIGPRTRAAATPWVEVRRATLSPEAASACRRRGGA